MEFHHLAAFLSLFYLALLGVQASLPAEDYWQSLWPNTSMPKALRDLMQPGSWNWTTKGRAHAKLGHNNDICQRVFYWSTKENDPTRNKDKVLNGTFFFEHDLHLSNKLKPKFTKHSDEFTFLPDIVAKTIPFSSSRLPEILNHFELEAKSTDAETMKYTLELCESPAIQGEEKYYATSLESLVNFAVSKLGKNISLLSTKFEKETQNQQQYTVVEGVKKNGDKEVVCHKLNYPYAVFYCHKIDHTRAYTVPLVATSDGTKAKALAVCHMDTSHWNAEHVAFKQLKVKPGTIPICHFLATDALLWVPN